MLSNPPFGVKWEKVAEFIRNEHKTLGHNGRFGAGLPRITDGAMLFLQHMVAKMQTTDKGGSRMAIVLNGSPLFNGGADSGESHIREWIIGNDWLEAVIGLPPELFYNTGLSTYLWVLSNRKDPKRRGKVQLIDARALFRKMRKSLGNKRNELAHEHIEAITSLSLAFAEGPLSKTLPNEALGYRLVTVDRPLRIAGVEADRVYTAKEIKAFLETGTRDDAAPPVIRKADKIGKANADPLHGRFEAVVAGERSIVEYAPDADLRDTEQVPLREADGVDAFIRREVLPYASDAWYDPTTVKVGYEIGFTRYFYSPQPLRPLNVIREDISALERETQRLFSEIEGVRE